MLDTARGFTDPAVLAEADAKQMPLVDHVRAMLARCLRPATVVAIGLSATVALMGGHVSAFASGPVASAFMAVGKTAIAVLGERSEAGKFDTVEVADALAAFDARARDVLAAKRGTAWIVSDPARYGLVVMDDREYVAFRRELAASDRMLDEVVIQGDALVVRRYDSGVLNAGTSGLPAVERFDLSSGEATGRAWFGRGTRGEPDPEPDLALSAG